MIVKSQVSDLAAFGGSPAFPEALHVGRPNIGNRDRLLERFNDLLDRAWLTNNGPFVEEFETAICHFTGAKNCISMSSGTVGLEIAIRAAGLTGEVIVPSFTFIATAHALQWQGVTPIFCDIDPVTHNLDPQEVEKLITERTSGIVGVHLWGRPCDVESLETIARSRSLKLLFDAAHAFGCSHRGRMVGNFGDAEVLSFHATKVVNTFEGGAVVTNDDSLAEKVRLMSRFGFADYDEVIYLGTNAKMTEVAAAMGLGSLEALEGIVAANHRNYQRYRSHLADLPGVAMLQYDESEQCNYQHIVLEIDASVMGLDRDRLQRILWAENVLARRYFYPGCHAMEPYRTNHPEAQFLLPHTERLAGRVLVLPTGSSMSLDDVDLVCHLIAFAARNAEQIRRR